MKKLKFKANIKQSDILHGIAFRNADIWFMHEYYQDDKKNPDYINAIEENRRTMHSLFDEADKAGIPFWVQNHALSFAEDWRRYKGTYGSSYLRQFNIDVCGW